MNKEINNEEKVEVNDYVVIELTELKSNISKRYCYQIIENYEHGRKENLNKVSSISPLGICLLSGKVGDTGKYNVHEYHYQYKILDIIKYDNEQINDHNISKPKIKIRTKKD